MNDSQLQIIIKDSNLEGTESESLLAKFGNYEKIAKEWEIKAKNIVVTNASQVTEMQMAKVARKQFSDLRIEVEKSRKALKEQSLRKGQAIDAIARFLVSLISPIENHLRLQEDFIKIEEAKKAEQLKIEAEKKEAEELRLKEEAEKKEQERIRLENIKLRAEAEEKERALVEERKKAAEERAKQDEILRKEREEAERKLMAERAEANRVQAEIRAKAEKERREAEEKANAERVERERMQKLLDEQIECPFCHKKFNK